MKKKFTLHLDAMLVLVILFITVIAFVIFLQFQVKSLTEENQQLQWQAVADGFNLDSQAKYIKKLQKQIAEQDKPIP